MKFKNYINIPLSWEWFHLRYNMHFDINVKIFGMMVFILENIIYVY